MSATTSAWSRWGWAVPALIGAVVVGLIWAIYEYVLSEAEESELDVSGVTDFSSKFGTVTSEQIAALDVTASYAAGFEVAGDQAESLRLRAAIVSYGYVPASRATADLAAQLAIITAALAAPDDPGAQAAASIYERTG